MDDPIAEIPHAINACAGAPDPDSQIAAFQRYFTRDASFLHPLCYVPPRTDSLDRVIGIYLFYRIAIPVTSFEVTSVAFDEDKGKLYVDLWQMPYMRGVSWVAGGWVPRIRMHVHFWVRREEREGWGRWCIYQQEDTVQPMEFLLAIPPLRPLGIGFYWFCEMMGLMFAWIFTGLGFWRPQGKMMKHHLRVD